MLALVLQGIGLGVTAGLSPGPLQIYVINSALRLGWRRSLITAFTPIFTDSFMVPIILLLLGQLSPEWIRILQIIGGGYVLWLAFQSWRSIRAGATIAATGEGTLQPREIILKAMMVNLLSPGMYIFWATVNGPLLIRGLRESVWIGIAFLVAFYGTFVVLLIGWVLIFDRLRQLDPRIVRAILLLTVVILVVFGLSLIWQGVSTA